MFNPKPPSYCATHPPRRQVFHATGDLERKRHKVLVREGLVDADGALVAGGGHAPHRRSGRGSLLAEVVAQVAVRRVLDYDVQRAILRAAAQQVDDVDVPPDHLHHLHLRHQVHHLGVRVALLEHLDRHCGGDALLEDAVCLGAHHLAERALAQAVSQLQAGSGELPIRVHGQLVLGDGQAVRRGGALLLLDLDHGHEQGLLRL